MKNSSDLIKGMNPRQKEAVMHTQGPLLVMAGAGSGKTRVLTHRMAYILAEEAVQPWNILAITFTNKAANEMKERVAALVGEQAQDMWVSTFHSMCVRILRRDCERIGLAKSFTIIDSGDQLSAMKRIMQKLNIDTDRYEPRGALATISNAKNNFEDAETFAKNHLDYVSQIYAKCYKEYQAEMRKNMTVDFDDLIMLTVKLFQEHQDVLDYYQQKFHYIHVDEYQDTNHAQYLLVKLLADKFKNICVVGDADQSIYGWRGADMENILSFEQDYPDAKVVLLEQNYRSTKTILKAANQVIENNVNRKPKELWTDNEAGEKITYYCGQSGYDESRYVISTIQKMVNFDGYDYSDFAVLYRSNAQSRAIEEDLLKANMPFKMVGGQRFYERMEIKDLLAYLRLLVNPTDDFSFRRVVNAPKRGIGDKSIEKLALFAEMHSFSLLEAAGSPLNGISGKAGKGLADFAQHIADLTKMQEFVTLTDLIEEVMTKSGYITALEQARTMEADARIDNMREFLSVAKEFEEQRLDREAEESPLVQFLTDLSLVTDMESEEDTSASQITLMTLHAAKGLEFPVVFLVGMEDGIFPSGRSLQEDGEEEERRLAYVGITRAEKKLFMTRAYSRLLYGKTQNYRESRFMQEIDDSLLEKEGVTVSDSYYSSSFYTNDSKSSYGTRSQTSSYGARSTSQSTSSTGGGGLFDRYRSSSQSSSGGGYLQKKQTTPARIQRADKPQASSSSSTDGWTVGMKVSHKKWGTGTVVRITGEGDRQELDVAFAGMGIKRLLASFAPIEKIEE